MAVKDIVKASGLAALGLASSAVAVLAQNEAPLFAYPPLPPMPDLPAITDTLNFLLGVTEGDAQLVMYKIFFMVVVAGVTSWVLSKSVFQNNKYLGVIIGFALSILAVKSMPDAAVKVFAGYFGFLSTSFVVFIIPISILAFTWFNTDNWKVRGGAFALVGISHLVTVGFVDMFATIFDIAVLVTGLVMFFKFSRVRAMGRISESASVALHNDLRVDLQGIMNEHALTTKAINLARTIRTAFTQMNNPIPPLRATMSQQGISQKIRGLIKTTYNELGQLDNILRGSKRLFGTMMAEIERTVTTYESNTTLNASAKTELSSIKGEAAAAKAQENIAVAEAENLFRNIYTLGLNKSTAIGYVTNILTHLEKEDMLLKKIRSALAHVESEIAA